ncbi:MAG TPA: hypothetical protein VI215_07275 [Bacteroidota bacterium]|jgi:hypothetical protein
MGEEHRKEIGKPDQAHTAPAVDRYILWRLPGERGQERSAPEALVISMGEHGAMVVTPATREELQPGVISAGGRIDPVQHNLAEKARAREEGMKWERRLSRSPLGKTQQDFVAYYSEVVALFTEWCASHGETLPSP